MHKRCNITISDVIQVGWQQLLYEKVPSARKLMMKCRAPRECSLTASHPKATLLIVNFSIHNDNFSFISTTAVSAFGAV